MRLPAPRLGGCCRLKGGHRAGDRPRAVAWEVMVLNAEQVLGGMLTHLLSSLLGPAWAQRQAGKKRFLTSKLEAAALALARGADMRGQGPGCM